MYVCIRSVCVMFLSKVQINPFQPCTVLLIVKLSFDIKAGEKYVILL